MPTWDIHTPGTSAIKSVTADKSTTIDGGKTIRLYIDGNDGPETVALITTGPGVYVTKKT